MDHSLLCRARASHGAAILLALALASSTAHAQPQGEWRGDFSIPAFDGDTRAALVHQSHPVVGGKFQWVGGVATSNIARWNGTAWEPLGAGLSAPVTKIADYRGAIVAGTTSVLPARSVMTWNGSSWSALGDAPYGEATALFASGDTLWAGIDADGEGYVARYDGTSWQTLGGHFDGRVRCLAKWNDSLYAGGEFVSGDAGFLSRIARWDGAHWQNVGGGTGAGASLYVAALAVWNGRLAAGGYFPSMGGANANGLATWDGTTWTAVPDAPQDVQVAAMVVEGTRLQLAGLFQKPSAWGAGLVTVDESGWNPPPSYPDWTLADLAAGDGVIVGAGTFSGFITNGTVAPARNVTMRVNGNWTLPVVWRPGMRGLLGPAWTSVSALREVGGELYSGGYFESAATSSGWRNVGSVARWDGDSWTSVGNFGFGNINALGEWQGKLVAGGAASPNFTYSVVNVWNGANWQELGGDLDGYVSTIVSWRDSLVVAGWLRRGLGGTQYVAFIRRGATWMPLGVPPIPGTSLVSASCVHAGELYLGGAGLPLTDTKVATLVRWNGSAWEAVAPTIVGWVTALLSRPDGMYVAADTWGQPGSRVRRMTGLGFEPLGTLYGNVTALGTLGNRVLATGSLQTIDGGTTLALWDGTEWRAVPGAPPIGSGGYPGATAEHAGDLWIGGRFTRLAAAQSEAIARWTPAQYPAPAQLAFERVWPQPARGACTFRFALPRAGRVKLAIHDVTGALVAVVADEALGAGTYERAWNGRSSRGAVPAGVYFARLVTPAGEVHGRVVVVP